MRIERYRVKLYQNPHMMKGGVWGVFYVLSDGRVSAKPFIISTRGPGYLLDRLAAQRSRWGRKKTHVARLADVRRQAAAHFGERQIVPRGFDH